MQRIECLADKNRPENFVQKRRPNFKRMVPLLEILAESLIKPVSSPVVLEEYRNLIKNFGSEFSVLLKIPVDEIEKVTSPRVAEGVDKVRRGDIVIEPGYDGVYGVVKIWNEKEKGKEKPIIEQKEKQAGGQISFFD
jgi:PHP family Zn ribbon phosphoesterase